jgi:hypothetical protein
MFLLHALQYFGLSINISRINKDLILNRFVASGGGNQNAMIMFYVTLCANCAGICIVFIRHRRLSLLSTNEQEEEVKCDVVPITKTLNKKKK